MKKIISTTAVSTILLCGGLSSSYVLAQGEAALLNPTAPWNVNSLGHGSQSYCALSRPYEEGLVLTMGQNLGKEYSLAVDFQDAGLNTSQSYKVALQPGPGQVRAYQLRAASQRALVVRIGDDAGFISALEKSGNLKVQVNGQDYNFDLADFAQGQEMLNGCMQKLGSAPVKMAKNLEVPKAEKMTAEEAAASKAEAEKMAEEKVAQQTAAQEAAKQAMQQQAAAQKAAEQKVAAASNVVEAPKAMPKPEAVKSEIVTSEAIEAPEPIIVERAAPAPAATVEKSIEEMPKMAVKVPTEKEAEATVTATVPPKKPAAPKTTSNVKVSRYEPIEERRLDPQSVKSRSNLVSKKSASSNTGSDSVRPSILSERPALPNDSTQSASVKEVPKPEVIASKEIETPKVQDEKEMVSAKPVEVPKPVMVEKKPAEVASAQKTSPSKESVKVSRVEKQQLRVWGNALEKKQQDELERIKAENKRLNEALRAQINSPTQSSAKPDDQVSELKAQVAKLEAELAKKPKSDAPVSPEMQAEIEMLRAENKKLVGSLKSQETKMDNFDTESPTALKELQTMREEVALLKKQNERLSKEAMKANNQIDGARMDAGNMAMEKIREYEKRLEAAKEDNLMLSREIEAMKNRKDEVALAAASGDWDLEKATRRYNEAEREISRLGMLLEQQRSAHRDERNQLEQMLFDPAVTDKQQRRRLAELESKLLAAERQLEAMGRARPQDRYDGSLARLDAPRASAMTPQPVPARPMPKPKRYAQYQTPFPESSAPVAPVTAEAMPKQMPRPPAVQDRKPVAAQQPMPAPQQVEVKTAEISQLLRRSGIQSSNVQQNPNGQYQWSAGNVSGVAQVQSKSQYGSVDQFAQQYISRARSACAGDFASSAANPSSGRLQSYDMVCIGGSQDVASSVVFAEQGNNVMAITHIANTDNLDIAIDLRDRVADKL